MRWDRCVSGTIVSRSPRIAPAIYACTMMILTLNHRMALRNSIDEKLDKDLSERVGAARACDTVT